MILRILAALMLLLCVTAIGEPATAAGPFPTASPRASSTEPAAEAPGLVGRYLLKIRMLQASFHKKLADRAGGVAATGGTAAFLSLIAVGFVYGVFHAAGPGHGKVVVTSYLLANVARRGLLLAAAASAAQAVSAIALVGAVALILGLGHFSTMAGVRYMEMASYALLVAVGIMLMRRALRGEGCGHDDHVHDHGHRHDHAHHHGQDDHGHDHHACTHGHHHAPPTTDDRRGFLPMVAAVGLRPCSGAVILLLFCLAQGIFLAGVAGTIAMSIGTAITVSALAILSVGARGLALRLAGDGVWFSRIHTGLALLGAAVITLFGLSMLAAELWGGGQPF